MDTRGKSASKEQEMKQKYKLETITPVHIGSGETLNHIDGYYANGRWYRIDLDKVLAHPNTDFNALTSEMSRRDFRWINYFSHYNMNGTELSTYNLLCSQNPKEVDIREAIKSVGNHPYIPGSSIKGAIRTALLSDLISNEDNEKLLNESSAHLNRKIDEGMPPRHKRDYPPAQQIEKLAFGEDPNHDLLRALQVGDTEPLESDALAIETAWTVTLNQEGELIQKIDGNREYKNYVEVIQGVKSLTFTIKIDDLLFRDSAKERLNFNDLQEKTLREMAEVCKFETNMLMEDEQDFFSEYHYTEIANRYDQLIGLNTRLSKGAFMLQIGWGTGYNANTVTSLFTQGDDPPVDLMALRERYRLGRSRSNQQNPYDSREFPKTRRVLYRGQNPAAPLGWVKISPIEDE